MNIRNTPALALAQLQPSEGQVHDAAQSRFIHEHQTCAMCESELEITHEINEPDLKVKEQAYCPSCGIRVRSALYLMH